MNSQPLWKYKIGQQVFYYNQGAIWHCRIVAIRVIISSAGNKITYDIMPYNETLFTKLCDVSEDNLVTDIQAIIDIIPIK